MVTTLSVGDEIHVGDSVTLTLLAVEGNLIHFGVESSESGVLAQAASSDDESSRIAVGGCLGMRIE
jgi:hypothetical protein